MKTRRDSRSMVKPSPRSQIPLGWRADTLVWAPPFWPVLGLGPPRSGKTTRIAAPALAAWDGPAIALSVRTDLAALTAPARQARGRVAMFDPSGTASLDLPITGWDPLRTSWSWAGAVDTASGLVHGSASWRGLNDSEFWSVKARQLLAPLLHAAAVTGRDMATVIRWQKTQELNEVIEALEASPTIEAAHTFSAVLALEERTRCGIYASLDAALAVYDHDGAIRATRRGLDIERLLAGPNTLYVVAPPDQSQSDFAPLLTTLVRAVLKTAYDAHARTGLPPRLLVLIDEAANIAPVEGLDTLATTAAGTGIQLVTLFHDLAQVAATYGPHRAETIVGNHPVLLALPSRDRSTARLLDDLIGDDPPHDLPSGEGVSRLRRIPRGSAVAAIGTEDPTLLRLCDPIADADLRLELVSS